MAVAQPCILIVEDDHDTRVELRRAIEAEGFSVFSAASGRDAIVALRTLKPSLILLDQNMPVMSGDDFLAMKNQTPSLAPIPVIVMSAFPDRISSSGLGIQAFLPKPIDLDVLMKALRPYCRSD